MTVVASDDSVEDVYNALSVTCIPDCLLVYEKNFQRTSETSYLRGLFLRQAMQNQGIGEESADDSLCHKTWMPSNLSCNANLLAKQIWQVVTEPVVDPRNPDWCDDDFASLADWMRVNQACDGPVEICYKMLLGCVDHNLEGCLTLLLGYCFNTDPEDDMDFGTAPSDRPVRGIKTSVTNADLRRLIRHAIDKGYSMRSQVLDELITKSGRLEDMMTKEAAASSLLPRRPHDPPPRARELGDNFFPMQRNYLYSSDEEDEDEDEDDDTDADDDAIEQALEAMEQQADRDLLDRLEDDSGEDMG